jgi:hypothetical protein
MFYIFGRWCGIQTQKKKRHEWNPKGSLGSKLKRREKRVESQGKLGIQTQKKRETSGIPREETQKKTRAHPEEEAPYSILHPIFVPIPTDIVIQVRGWYERGGGRPQPGLENDKVISDPEEERWSSCGKEG